MKQMQTHKNEIRQKRTTQPTQKQKKDMANTQMRNNSVEYHTNQQQQQHTQLKHKYIHKAKIQTHITNKQEDMETQHNTQRHMNTTDLFQKARSITNTHRGIHDNSKTQQTTNRQRGITQNMTSEQESKTTKKTSQ